MAKLKWLTGGYVFILVLIILIVNLGLGPVYFPLIYKIPGLDEIGHFFLLLKEKGQDCVEKPCENRSHHGD